MELTKFDKAFSKLTKTFRKGFYKKPDKFEIDVFGKIIDYQLQALIITSRIEDDITENTAHTKYIFELMEQNKKISHSDGVKGIINFFKLSVDLTDFYLYTRMFLDALTVGIQRSFIASGKKECIMGDTVSCLLNEKQMKAYKEKIDPIFFGNLEKHLSWIRTLRDSRGDLVHDYYHIVSTATKQGDLGFEIMDRKKPFWGTETVKGISVEIQTAIDNITDLMDFLSINLPQKQKSGKTGKAQERNKS